MKSICIVTNNLILGPPRVENNETLSVWFCEQHNIVNKFLGKKEFDCSFSNLQKRWKDGYPHCGDDSALY